jgi:mannosyltransferase
MKIIYDLIYFSKEQHGGISTMWKELFNLLPMVDIEPAFILPQNIDNTTNDYLKQVNYFEQSVFSDRVYFNSRILKRLSGLGLFRSFLLLKYLYKDYINPIIPLNKIKIVLTVHDMVFWDHKNCFVKNISYWDKVWSIYHSLLIANQIVTVSEATKKSIVDKFPWAEQKITVIYHGLPQSFYDLKIYHKKEKYFLFIGGRNPYKNYDLLLEAFVPFSKKYPDWQLHVVGENAHCWKEETEKYERLGLKSRILDHGLISQERLIKLLQKASATVIPSLNEGFNFPLLEAMSAGCPVISSDIPVSREIGLHYPTFFLNNTSDLIKALEYHACCELDLEDLLKSQAHARTFRWQNSMEKLFKVYESCI